MADQAAAARRFGRALGVNWIVSSTVPVTTASKRHGPDIAVVVLYFRCGSAVFDTLRALQAQTLRPSAIILVDNASDDGVINPADERLAGVTIAVSGKNRGYGGGMNFGLDRVPESDSVLLLTHDCLLAPAALEQMAQELARAADVGVVGPLMGNRAQRDRVFSAGGYFVGPGRDVLHHGYGDPLVLWRDGDTRDVEWVDGACQLIRRRTLDDVGPLDEDYFLYWEEVAYHTRVRARGWRVRCVTSAIAWQDPGEFAVYYRVRNQLRYTWRYQSHRAFARQLGRAAYYSLLFRGQRRTRLMALWDFSRGYSGPAR